MRHRKHHHQLGVKKEHRIALIANLAAALLKHGRIQTTLAKAKALRPFVEKIITLARKARRSSPERALYLRRLAIARVRDKGVVHLLFEQRVEEFLERNGGYTRIYKIGRRIGDGAEMALIELIDGADEGYRNSRRKSRKKNAQSPAGQEKSTEKAAVDAAGSKPEVALEAATPAPGKEAAGEDPESGAEDPKTG